METIGELKHSDGSDFDKSVLLNDPDQAYKILSKLTNDVMKTTNMKTSKKAITNYIIEKINYASPSTCDTYTIYLNVNTGELTHTTGSMEYRDDAHKEILSIEFKNEFAPYSKKCVSEMVKFGLEEKKEMDTYMSADA